MKKIIVVLALFGGLTIAAVYIQNHLYAGNYLNPKKVESIAIQKVRDSEFEPIVLQDSRELKTFFQQFKVKKIEDPTLTRTIVVQKDRTSYIRILIRTRSSAKSYGIWIDEESYYFFNELNPTDQLYHVEAPLTDWIQARLKQSDYPMDRVINEY